MHDISYLQNVIRCMAGAVEINVLPMRANYAKRYRCAAFFNLRKLVRDNLYDMRFKIVRPQ